jgi:hypothetical protein
MAPPPTPSRRTRAGAAASAGSGGPLPSLRALAARLADPADTRAACWVAALVLAAEAVLCAAIIVRVPCA